MSPTEGVNQPARADHPHRARQNCWLGATKLGVTVGILAFLLTRTDLAKLWTAIHGSLGGWFWLALLINSLLLVTSTWKWDRLLRSVGVFHDFRALLRLYTIGFFFSSFLPGTVGGDVVRWHAASATRDLRLKVAATILAERLTGVLALVGLSVLLVIWGREQFATPPTLIVLTALAAALLCGLWLAWSPGPLRLLRLAVRGGADRIVAPLHKLQRALVDLPPRALLASVAYSVPFYASGAVLFYLIARACGAGIGFLEAATVQVLICLLTLIPISLGGLGLAQAGDVYLLGLLGVDAPTALAMSLLRQAISYAYAVLGAFLFVSWSGHPSVSELRSSELSLPAAAPADRMGR